MKDAITVFAIVFMLVMFFPDVAREVFDGIVNAFRRRR